MHVYKPPPVGGLDRVPVFTAGTGTTRADLFELDGVTPMPGNVLVADTGGNLPSFQCATSPVYVGVSGSRTTWTPSESGQPTAASGASTFAYTATASPVPLASGDGLTFVGSGGAAVSTPTEPEWDATLSQGTTKPSPSLPAGVYLVTMSWTAAGADVAGAYAYFSAVDALAVPIAGNGLQINSPNLVQSLVVVADVPVRLGVVAGANNDDATRTFNAHLWATKIADFG